MLDDALVPGKTCRKYLHEYVSILVVLDDALVQGNIVAVTLPKGIVSILVVLDDALVPFVIKLRWRMKISLNPCCAGRCSSTIKFDRGLYIDSVVSILVVLDDALVHFQ